MVVRKMRGSGGFHLPAARTDVKSTQVKRDCPRQFYREHAIIGGNRSRYYFAPPDAVHLGIGFGCTERALPIMRQKLDAGVSGCVCRPCSRVQFT
jgi:hypothetical protein